MKINVVTFCCILLFSSDRNAFLLADKKSDKAPDPCNPSVYKVLKDADRAVGFVTNGTAKCDRSSKKIVPSTWYRFQEPAGLSMPTSCIDTMRCGGKAPGWLRGGHPSVSEGIVTKSVCYHWNKKCCYYKNNIQVKKCRGFFIYKFEQPPAKNLRYCGNGTGLKPPSSESTCKKKGKGLKPPSSESTCKKKEKGTEKKAKAEPDPCYLNKYIYLSGADRAAESNTAGKARCDLTDLPKEEAWYRFYGNAGSRMAKKCPPRRRCGTNAPGWMNGPLPREYEGIVNRTVCFNWNGDCCHWKSNIKVRNCGSFYLYYLKRDPWGGCSYRYCGNGKGSTKPTKETVKPTTPTIEHPTQPEANVTCVQDEMWISIPKSLLHGLKREELRLNDVDCVATETPSHYVLHTGLTDCGTRKRHTKNFVCYTNTVLQIPVKDHAIITRIREVEIPFSCYYSNMGVVSSVGLEVKSKKIVFSEKGFGKFVLELKLYPRNKYSDAYTKDDFPVYVPLRKRIYAEVSVDTKDRRLQILAEECFATSDPDPYKSGLKYTFIRDGCAVDDTVQFIDSDDKTTQRFSMEAFKFLGDHQFVYMHCKVKICNATDSNSRCAKGCIEGRHKRSIYAEESSDDEYMLGQGPFVRQEEEENAQIVETAIGMRADEIRDAKNGPWIFGSVVTVAICLTGVSFMTWNRNKNGRSVAYMPLYTSKDD